MLRTGQHALRASVLACRHGGLLRDAAAPETGHQARRARSTARRTPRIRVRTPAAARRCPAWTQRPGAHRCGAAIPTRSADLERRFARVAATLQPAGGLWVVWPKRTAGTPTDLTENVVREICLAGELVDNKVCAVDETWSRLRFVIRLKDRVKPEAVIAPSAPPRSRARRVRSALAPGLPPVRA
jgi:hypothetical protein